MCGGRIPFSHKVKAERYVSRSLREGKLSMPSAKKDCECFIFFVI